jgi:HD superfamily phosphohydrolase YqeK
MGREDMSPLEQVLFLADKLDPSKVSRYPFVAEVAELARRDLDRAMVRFIDGQVPAFLAHGDLVHPGMAAARNTSLLRLKGR